MSAKVIHLQRSNGFNGKLKLYNLFFQLFSGDEIYGQNGFCIRLKQGASYLERGRESRLVIDNVTYEYQGEYECRATNYINGQERVATSEPVQLQVVGKSRVPFLWVLNHIV